MAEEVISIKLTGEEPPPSTGQAKQPAPSMPDLMAEARTKWRTWADDMAKAAEGAKYAAKLKAPYKIAEESRGPGEDEHGNRPTAFKILESDAKNISSDFAKQFTQQFQEAKSKVPIGKLLVEDHNAQLRDQLNRQTREKYMGAALATQNLLGGGGMGQKVAGGIQLAGSGVLGQGALAMAGGPVGAAVQAGVIVYDLLKEAIGRPFAAARLGIEELGKTSQAVARNDGLGAVTGATKAASEGIEKLGLAGKVVGESLKTVAVGLEVFEKTLHAFTDRGRELGKYDGRIASATAQADVRKIMADMSEAKRLGAQYARLIESQSRMEARLQETLLPIKEKMMQLLERWMPTIVKLLETAMEAAEVSTDVASEGWEVWKATVPLLAARSEIWGRALDRIEGNTRPKADAEDMLNKSYNKMIADLRKLKLTPAVRDPAIRAADRSLKLPAFG